MMQYAVMGNPIDHSLSPIIHQAFAKQFGLLFEYGKILIDVVRFPAQVAAFFQQGGKGLNITAPCKQQAFAISDEITPCCASARAANTLWQQAGNLVADNTDGVGLLTDLRRHMDLRDKHILILGAGGAVRGILQPLLDAQPCDITIVNRTEATALALQSEFQQMDKIKVGKLTSLSMPYDLVLHALPRDVDDKKLLPSIIFQPTTLAYDLAYHVSGITPFVAYARAQGAIAMDGFGMLVCQAAASFQRWHGVFPDVMPVMEARE